MLEGYTRVATQSWLGIGMFLATGSLLLLASATLARKKKQFPLALTFFTIGATALTFLPWPRSVWMNREIVLVCAISIPLLMWQLSTKKELQQLLMTLPFMIPLVSLCFEAYGLKNHEGTKSVELWPTVASFEGGRSTFRALPAKEIGLSWTPSGLYVSTATEWNTTIEPEDIYRSRTGEYLDGRAVAARVESWLKAREKPEPRKLLADGAQAEHIPEQADQLPGLSSQIPLDLRGRPWEVVSQSQKLLQLWDYAPPRLGALSQQR